MPIKKYVLPVAGLGTRFLPATKAIPKEMLPIVDKPLIQYVVEEAVEAGATEIILVTHPSKRALEDHFDINVELERTLEKKGKTQLLERVRTILPENIRVAAVRQHEPLGLGHAVLCAKELVGNEPFGVILPDVLIHHPQRGCMAQMMKVYQQLGHSIIAVEPVAHDQVDKYGIVSLEAGGEEGLRQLSGIVEKPTPENAPSNLSVVGRYILPPRVMQLLEQTTPGSGGEIQLTDAIAALIQEEPVYAYTFEGTSYDCGNKQGFLRANIDYGLRDPETREGLLQQMSVQSHSPDR